MIPWKSGSLGPNCLRCPRQFPLGILQGFLSTNKYYTSRNGTQSPTKSHKVPQIPDIEPGMLVEATNWINFLLLKNNSSHFRQSHSCLLEAKKGRRLQRKNRGRLQSQLMPWHRKPRISKVAASGTRSSSWLAFKWPWLLVRCKGVLPSKPRCFSMGQHGKAVAVMISLISNI